jgi:hypothetical protein
MSQDIVAARDLILSGRLVEAVESSGVEVR